MMSQVSRLAKVILVVGFVQGTALWLSFNLALFSCVFTCAWIVANGWDGKNSPQRTDDLWVIGSTILSGLAAACVTWLLCRISAIADGTSITCSTRDFDDMWLIQGYGLLLVGLLYWVSYRVWIALQRRRL